jgi:predicted GNAT superfamily acetyltransferase
MAGIDIRPVDTLSDIRQIETIQLETWGMDDLEVIPARFMHALQHNGASLLGAYDGQRIVGFVFGVLGTVEDLDERIDQVAAARLQMYSVIMGVLPEYQGMGIGHRLKLAQREFALRIGVRLITWTFDPLESRNAHLNITKLGVISHRYERDFPWAAWGHQRGFAYGPLLCRVVGDQQPGPEAGVRDALPVEPARLRGRRGEIGQRGHGQ